MVFLEPRRLGVFRMIDSNKHDLELTPFEQAQVNCEMFATNLVISAGLQEAIRCDLECDYQIAAMGEDPEVIAEVRADQERAAGKILIAPKMLQTLGISA